MEEVEKEELTPTIEDAKKVVTEHDFIVLTKDEYTQLQSKQAERTDGKNKRKKAPKQSVITYKLVVTTGMTTGEIASLLNENGIIRNQQDFINFMATNGYSKSIQLGTFQLTNQMNFAEIADLLISG